jgi:serine/threonine protein kinase
MATPIDYDFKTMQQVEACGYEPIQKKGQGTYGFVYEVGDSNGDLFAFKYIFADDFYKQSGLDSLNEIDILSRVHHPHIIHAAKIITANNCNIDGTAVVLPLADRTLYDIIKDPQMTTDDKLPILYKLATALEFMHRSRILHLDIKSTNVVLQGDIPYMIDFGLSMVVDNVSIGKYDRTTRVTIDHRSPEILEGGRTYNAAVDVWAFGIMLLYVLSGQGIFNVDFSTIKSEEFHQVVVDKFSTPNTIVKLLSGVRPLYKDLCVDLLSKILQIVPDMRLTADQICNHPLFDKFREPIVGVLEIPPIPYDYATDQRDILKLMIHWSRNLYPAARVELLFLAIDLFNRISSFFKTNDPVDRMGIGATCLWIASKLTNGPQIPLNIYIEELSKMVQLTSDMILKHEISIVYFLSGVLNVSALYSICENTDELKFTFEEILINRDSTLYARVDVKKWGQVMKQHIQNSGRKDKNISISEFMS